MTEQRDLDEIYLQYVDPIRNYLYRLSGNRHLAEDLVQEVFYRAMRQLLTGVEITYISSWLYRIARNLYLDYVKKARLPEESLEALTAQSGDLFHSSHGLPEETSLRHEEQDQIQRAIAALPENQRTALLLRDVEGLSYEEVAATMGLSLSAVKSCLFRARQRFAQLYSEGEG